MPHALITGGTGAIGFATSRRLTQGGWTVEVTGRDREHFPPELAALGVRFTACDRDDAAQMRSLVGSGADLLVDCGCKTGEQARAIVDHLGAIGSTVLISSRAVYVDAQGRHMNSAHPPQFDGPISESQPTLRPDGSAPGTREGYGPNKVAAEETLLDSGSKVSVLRASKVHGAWSRRPREWVFLKRVLDRRGHVFLSEHGGDHCSAAVNIAALIELLAANPGAGVLNIADPDVPAALDIARLVTARMGHSWEEVLVADECGELGRTPWDLVPPVVLDTTAAAALGYRAVGTYAETVGEELDWLLREHRTGGWALPGDDDPFFEPFFAYGAEDRYLSARGSR